MENEHTTIALIQKDIEYIRKAIDEIKASQKMYVTRAEFLPIKILVYGFVAIILSGVVGLWITRSLKTFPAPTVQSATK